MDAARALFSMDTASPIAVDDDEDDDNSAVPIESSTPATRPAAVAALPSPSRFNLLTASTPAVPASAFTASTPIRFAAHPAPQAADSTTAAAAAAAQSADAVATRVVGAADMPAAAAAIDAASPTKRAYDELVRFFTSKGDRPLTTVEAERVQRFIDVAT
ncbi:hypothetical protein HK405_014586, partial [Cladochytrium tenue]